MGHNYTRAEGQAARLLAADSGLSRRATNLRDALESIAKYGVMGFGTVFAQYASDHRLYDQLVAKGLVVVTGEKNQRRWTLAPATKERFDGYVAHFQAEIDAAEAQKKAESDAAAAAQAEAEAKRMYAVMISDTRQIFGRIDGKVHQQIFTGPTGKADAEAYAASLREGGNAVTMVFEITEIVNS